MTTGTTGVEGYFDAKGLKFAIVVSRFNDAVTARLLRGAEDCLERHGCLADQRTVVRVPGAWELPQVARKLALSERFDGVVALGALIRGATPHFDYIAAQCAHGLARAAFESGIPVVFGVLTTDTVDQALERSGGKTGNKGWDAALSVVEMANLYRRLA